MRIGSGLHKSQEERIIMDEIKREKKEAKAEKKSARQKENREKKRKKRLMREILESNPLLRQKKIICFDLYWTLIKRPNSLKTIKSLFKIFGVEPFKKLHKVVQTVEKKDIKLKCEEIWLKINKYIMDLFDSHTEKEIDWTVIHEETLEVLKALKDNWYKLAVISNISEDFEKPFNDLIPNDLFDYKAFSYKQKVMKPNSLMFKKILDDANDDAKKDTDNIIEYKMEDMIMIWDSLKDDVNWAKNAWMDAILLDRGWNKISFNKEKNIIKINTLRSLYDIFWIEYQPDFKVAS